MNKKEIWKVFEGGGFMSLTLKERRAVVREVAKRYNIVILNLFQET